jgi:hypothetical protein
MPIFGNREVDKNCVLHLRSVELHQRLSGNLVMVSTRWMGERQSRVRLPRSEESDNSMGVPHPQKIMKREFLSCILYDMLGKQKEKRRMPWDFSKLS